MYAPPLHMRIDDGAANDSSGVPDYLMVACRAGHAVYQPETGRDPAKAKSSMVPCQLADA